MEDTDVMRAIMAATSLGGAAGQDMFPVKTKQWRQEVNGHPTDFVLCLFSNCVFAIVTQLGKLGTIMRISKDEATSSSGEDNEATFAVDTLLGKRDDPALVVCGRQIVEDIAQHSTRSLLLSIALHDNSRATLREIVEAIKANRLWGQNTEAIA